jgi:hypothetical protein
MAAFHRVLFEQKVVEAVELLAALGAKEIQVRQVMGSEASKDVAASVLLPGVVNVGGAAGQVTKHAGEVLYNLSLDPAGPPHVPPNLQWYPHERFWQSVAKLRLEGGLLDFSLDVSYEDDFGVNAKLTATVESIGLDLGGKYADLTSTKWQMRGSFWPLEAHPA